VEYPAVRLEISPYLKPRSADGRGPDRDSTG
jgi:hypothetical protein